MVAIIFSPTVFMFTLSEQSSQQIKFRKKVVSREQCKLEKLTIGKICLVIKIFIYVGYF